MATCPPQTVEPRMTPSEQTRPAVGIIELVASDWYIEAAINTKRNAKRPTTRVAKQWH